jgi:hypothetical protein
MELALLATLKDKLVQASDFFKVYEYFLDQFGEDPEFIALGTPTGSPFLEAVLAEVGKQLFQKEVALRDVLLTRLPDQHFIHGTALLNGRIATVFYFEDVQMGLLAVAVSLSTNQMTVARFSGRRIVASKEPSVN